MRFVKLCVSTFSVLCEWTLFIKKFMTTHACFCFYVMEFRKQNKIFCTSQALFWFTQKKTGLILFIIQIFFFLSKNVISLYIFKFFFIMLKLKISLEYWIILYIFRISLCVTSPLHLPLVVEKYAKFTRVWPISSQCLISIPLDNAPS